MDGHLLLNSTSRSYPGMEVLRVLQAVERGEVSLQRYQSYIKLRKESEFHALSYLERRKKDRRFGRMIKAVKKQLRK